MTDKKIIVWNALKEAGFNMDKIEIFYDSVGVLTVRDFTFTFYNGIAKLNHINYYKKTVTLDIMRPDYLVHSQVTYNLSGGEKNDW